MGDMIELMEFVDRMKRDWRKQLRVIIERDDEDDPCRKPSGVGWRTAMSPKLAFDNASKEIVIKIGLGTSHSYFYR